MVRTGRDLAKIKRNIEVTETSEQDLDSSTVSDLSPADEHAIDSTYVKMAFSFEAPKISLRLITNSKKVGSDTLWCLETQMQGLIVDFQKKYFDHTVNLRVKSLRVTDNSDDERFQCIFENQPSLD
jgi:hypothetical protein